jgi:hypothetical protein
VNKFVKIGDAVWPTPMDEAETSLEWRLRYGRPEDLMNDRMCAASIVSAYRELITCPRIKRDNVIRALRRAVNGGASDASR